MPQRSPFAPRRRLRPMRLLGLAVVIGAAAVGYRALAAHPPAAVPAAARAPGAAAASRRVATLPEPGAGVWPVAVSAPGAPSFRALAVEVMDARTGAVLLARHAEREVQPASLAKMMTFDLVLRAMAQHRLTPATMVPISQAAIRMSLCTACQTSNMYLGKGTPVSAANLLKGLMISSGADASIALADYLGGSQANFVAMMNREAARLGMHHTHFVNPHGLYAKGQYSTAGDMALLARHIWLTYPHFYQYTNLPSFTWAHVTTVNYNWLVGHHMDAAVNGLKSGFVGQGWHLVATAHKGGQEQIAVVLGTPTEQASAVDDQALLDWAFAHFHDVPLRLAGKLPTSARVWEGAVTTVPLAVHAPAWLTLPGAATAKGAAPTIQVRLQTPLVAPLRQGQTVGTLTVAEAGRTVLRLPLTTTRAVARGMVVHVLWDRLRLSLRHA